VFQRNDNYVKLKKVTADNWEGVVELELGAGQEDLVTSNLYSFAEAQFDPDLRRLCREACSRLPDVQRAENEGQGEGSLDLSIHDPVFLRAIDALAVPGLLIGHRMISQGEACAAPRGDGVVVLFCGREAPRQWRRMACGARADELDGLCRPSDPKEHIWCPDLARWNRRLDGVR
jgi:hypothetical protein